MAKNTKNTAKANKSTKTVKTGPSNRTLMFQALSKAPEGLSPADLRSKMGMSPSNGAFGVIIRGEISASRIQHKHTVDGPKYVLLALGRKHYEAKTVDAVAREKHLAAAGRAWEAKTAKASKKAKKTAKKAKASKAK